jgi:hypothetical protein
MTDFGRRSLPTSSYGGPARPHSHWAVAWLFWLNQLDMLAKKIAQAQAQSRRRAGTRERRAGPQTGGNVETSNGELIQASENVETSNGGLIQTGELLQLERLNRGCHPPE